MILNVRRKRHDAYGRLRKTIYLQFLTLDHSRRATLQCESNNDDATCYRTKSEVGALAHPYTDLRNL